MNSERVLTFDASFRWVNSFLAFQRTFPAKQERVLITAAILPYDAL